MDEYIFLNVEPVNVAVRPFQELKEKLQNGRPTKQEFEVKDIKTSNREEPHIVGSAYDLGRTASAVFQMTMLRAIGIKKKFWPQNEDLYKANDTTAKQRPNLLDVQDETAARRYWSSYDQVFPPSFIQHKLLENIAKEVKFGNTMLIFRKNFHEVIEIKTDASAKLYERVENDRNFEGSVNVVCTRHEIQDGVECESFKELKKMIEAAKEKTTKDIEEEGERQRKRNRRRRRRRRRTKRKRREQEIEEEEEEEGEEGRREREENKK